MEILAYKTVDGRVFEDESDAEKHEVDLIGEELDGLISHVLAIDVSQSQKSKAILTAIKERKAIVARKEFKRTGNVLGAFNDAIDAGLRSC